MHIRDVEFAKDDNLKHLQPAKRLTWSAAGSETLTSDIDVNLKIDRLIKSAEPLIQGVNLNQGLRADLDTIGRIGQTAVRLKAEGKNRREQKQALKQDDLIGDWTVANLREIIIAIGTEVEKAFRPQ